MPARRTLDEASRLLTGHGQGCWPAPENVGTITDEGYVRLTVSGRRVYAHRLSYEIHVGPIPPGLTIDHQCHNEDVNCEGGPQCRHRRCINPVHLEVATIVANSMRGNCPPAQNARKTACKEGHPLVEILPGKRHCPTCRTRLRQGYGEISKQGRKIDRTHCLRGHEFTVENTYHARSSNNPSRTCRQCRACNAERARARRVPKSRKA